MSGTPTLRNWQEDAMGTLIARWKKPEQKPLIAASPGSGKTWFSVIASIHALEDFGIELVIVVAPSVNIKEQWRDTFIKAGIRAHSQADNEALRWRVKEGVDPTDGWRAICVTYSQLSKDAPLFIEIARRKKTLLIADEVHHADDKECFGQALEHVAEEAKLRLALSGTPFNSSGGALAMCDSVEELDELGRAVRKALPIYSYSYSDAILHKACRPTEFIKVLGKSLSTYKSLSNKTTWQKMVDLARENKTDSIGRLLEPDGDFFLKMATDALTALCDIRKTDRKAGMLVVAKDKDHGSKICRVIEKVCRSNPEWSDYRTQEIYNDTPKSHDRIRQLERDSTDIVITVRMISEGVDVKRLRVGLYATDYRTRMFFIQFVGRFIRWEDRLDDAQHARIVIPAHIDLINFAREIEKMVDDALVKGGFEDIDEPEASGTEKKYEHIGTDTEAGEDGLIYRGEEENDRLLAKAFFEKYPSLVGKLPEYMAAQAAKDDHIGGATHYTEPVVTVDWGSRNDQLVHRIVKMEKLNGSTDDDHSYRRINASANRYVGIHKKDKMTPPEILKKRAGYLKTWLEAIFEEREFVSA